MYIKSLILNNFKNFDSTQFEFSKVNCIVGNNGVGKTNILDAIYYLSFCRSFLGCTDTDIIRYGEDFFSLKGEYELDGDMEDVFTVSLKKGERKILKHGKQPYKKFSEHIGKIPCVIVSPSDAVYLTGRSEQRRKFMDIILSQTDSVYMDNLINYNRCLEQRNRLLKFFQQMNTWDTTQIEIWNDKLSRYAEIIKEKRNHFFQEFVHSFKATYSYISENKEDIDAQYITYNGDSLLELLEATHEKDKILGHTTKGIHRDDILFTINDHNVSYSASQGQQKTFVFALKLAQFDYLKKHKHTTPILLLDDIFDKFDFKRVQKILQLVITEKFHQVFITDTHPDRTEQIIPNAMKDESIIIRL